MDVPTRQLIDSYSDQGFTVNGHLWHRPIFVFAGQTQPWEIDGEMPDALTILSMAPAFDYEPAVELLLIGLGPSILALPESFRAGMKEKGIAIEPLDSGAACRTFNLLSMEGRRVAAALLPHNPQTGNPQAGKT